ncbi:MAG: transposase [bacterium]|nr:transposase [bacterium]
MRCGFSRKSWKPSTGRAGNGTTFWWQDNPPNHPKIMAGVILYGLSHGIRSSRRLEWACANAVDFMWLEKVRAAVSLEAA